MWNLEVLDWCIKKRRVGFFAKRLRLKLTLMKDIWVVPEVIRDTLSGV